MNPASSSCILPFYLPGECRSFASYIGFVERVGKRATITVGILVALPVFGAVGTITATGAYWWHTAD